MHRFSTVIFLALAVAVPRPSLGQDVGEPDGAAPTREMVQAELDGLRPTQGGKLRVVWPLTRRTPSAVHGLRWSAGVEGREDVARAFVAQHPSLAQVSTENLALVRTERTKTRAVLHFQQTWAGLKVLGGAVNISFDKDNRVLSFVSSAMPLDGLEERGDVGRQEAVEAARKAVGLPAAAGATAVGKAVFAQPGSAAVVYRVVLSTLPLPGKIVVVVDAATGKVLKVTDEVRK
jgi:Zn-dependent metalloprotease